MVIQIAERIKELREKNNLTQTELARRLHVTRSSVNAWEMAISIPSTEKILSLCSILHTTSDYLLGLDTGETLPLYQYSQKEKELLYQLARYFDEIHNNSGET
ncbi:MAG TPA: helix-turn-helix transcriptional regulator [Candidatus Merdisoma merdipullorum]|nr:helix-turn-helix transcriptional regulator [Candidatus Merdisoma merdipullorum]